MRNVLVDGAPVANSGRNDVGPAVVLNATGASETVCGVIVSIPGAGEGVAPEGKPTARAWGKGFGQLGE